MDNRLLWALAVVGLLILAGGGGYVLVSESENRAKWLPVLAAAEQQFGLPQGLLVRQAQEESSFSSSIINGSQASPAGALGILQLEPGYFQSVRGPVPFSDQATAAQITDAAKEMARLFQLYGSWALSLAAYNWGEGNLNSWLGNGEPAIPTETQDYVAQIVADVPAANDSALVNT